MRPTFARVAEMIWPKLAAACLASILAVLATPTPGQAQGFLSFLWDEGGAREVVPFHPRHTPGQIIVSFGDRRLYWVHRRGEAISYPIAIPREKSRWAGVTRVSDKRVNPAWTPTAEMRASRAYGSGEMISDQSHGMTCHRVAIKCLALGSERGGMSRRAAPLRGAAR